MSERNFFLVKKRNLLIEVDESAQAKEGDMVVVEMATGDIFTTARYVGQAHLGVIVSQRTLGPVTPVNRKKKPRMARNPFPKWLDV